MKDTVSTQIRNEILTIMEDGQTRSNDQIRAALSERGWNYDVDYKETHFSGTMYTLTAKKMITRLRRGVYVKASVSKQPASSDPDNFSSTASLTEESEQGSKSLSSETVLEIQKRIFPQVKALHKKLCNEFKDVTLNILESEKDIDRVKTLLLLKRDLEKLIADESD